MGNGMHAEKERIVIVEDDAKLAALIGEFLRSQDLDVELIEDGSRAVGTILANPPALVVLDLMLPGVDGLSVCRKLREAGFSRPILMLTARSDDQDHIRGLELGADDFVNKPRSEEHTSELQSRPHLVCRLLLEKKKKKKTK